MGDIDGPIIAAKVYQELFRGDATELDHNTIPYALDEAVHGVTQARAPSGALGNLRAFGLMKTAC